MKKNDWNDYYRETNNYNTFQQMKKWQKNKPLICFLVINARASNKKLHAYANKYYKQRCGNMNSRMIMSSPE